MSLIYLKQWVNANFVLKQQNDPSNFISTLFFIDQKGLVVCNSEYQRLSAVERDPLPNRSQSFKLWGKLMNVDELFWTF